MFRLEVRQLKYMATGADKNLVTMETVDDDISFEIPK